MKIKREAFIAILAITCFGASCDNPFVNLVYSISLRDNNGMGFSFLVGCNYPDTIIPEDYNEMRGCPPNRKVRYDSKKDWDEVFKGLPSDTLSVFIFEDVVTRADWESVRNSYSVSRRYDLSYSDLERLKWLVVYPPDNSMQGIKMYPELISGHELRLKR